jgi:hypothetical protein
VDLEEFDLVLTMSRIHHMQQHLGIYQTFLLKATLVQGDKTVKVMDDKDFGSGEPIGAAPAVDPRHHPTRKIRNALNKVCSGNLFLYLNSYHFE